MPATSNKTELSQKVEAELFTEYDAMVPGPATSVSGSVGAGGGGEGGASERTGRPLAINLDLLSYHARQKNLKVCFVERARTGVRSRRDFVVIAGVFFVPLWV